MHRWVGLTAGAVVAVVGLTGSLYVFAPELSAALAPDLLRPAGASPALDAREIVRRVEAATGGTVESVQWPLRERTSYQLKLFDRDDWLYVHPATGAVLGRDVDRATLRAVAWVLEVHTSLTLGDVGYRVTGASALALALVLVSSGLWFWWPRRIAQLRPRLTVRWRDATAKRRVFDLHAVGGAWASAVLVVLALTGAYWSFPDAAQRLVDVLTRSAPTPVFPSDAADEPRSVAAPGAAPRTVAQLLDATDSLFPGHARRNLWMTRDSAGVVYLSWIREPRIAAGGEYRPMAWLDRYTGAPLRVHDPTRVPLGTRLTTVWLPPVHFGEVGGLPTRVLAFVGGLAPLALYVTGGLMWWRRRRARDPRPAPPARRR